MRNKVLLLYVFASALFTHARQETPTKTRSETNARSVTEFSTNADETVLQQFQQWAENYAKVGASEKAPLSANGLSLAAERRRILAGLIESNPAEALRQTVPLRLRGKLPPEVAALLEERISGRGDFLVLATVPVRGAEKSIRPIEHFVILGGKKYEAFVYGRGLTQTTRRNIPIYGVAIDGKLAVHENPVPTPEPGEIPNSQLRGANPNEVDQQDIQLEDAAGLTAWTSGIKTVLFMRVNFPDDPTDPISIPAAISMMNNASNWFRDVSYHLTALNATVTPLLTLPRTKAAYQSSGDYIGLLNDARAVAKTSRFDTANFDLDCVNLTFTFPGWNGRAFVGDKGAWFQVGASLAITCHEFGHNYGLWHANFWNATDDTIIGPGTNEEYGNVFDTMGLNFGPEYQFNACYKNRLGWLPDANVATITNSGLYRIYAFDVPTLSSNLFYALKVRKDEREYWGELRSRFPGNHFIFNGLMLNWSPWQQSVFGTHLLDTTPGTDYNKNDCTITPGRTFTDPFAGIHLTPVRVNTNTVPHSIDVVANLGSFPANHPPTVSVSASATSVAVNAPVTFTATASDPDGDALAYFWEFRDPLGELGTNGPGAVKSWTLNGEFVVRCIVSDMKGGMAVAKTLITVGSPSGFRISGRILNGSTPVENVRVFGIIFNAYTDANGDYIMAGMSPGDYPLFAYKPGWVITPANFTNPVTIGPSASNVNFSGTPRTYSISGSVYDSGRQVVPGVTVTVGVTNSTVTDANGFYLFPNLFAGVYNLTASKPGYEIRPVNWTNPATVEWQDTFGKDFAAQLAFLLTHMRLTNGGFAFRLSGGSNHVIRIESSTNLVNWATLATVTNTTGQMDFLDAPFSTPRRFYRATILP